MKNLQETLTKVRLSLFYNVYCSQDKRMSQETIEYLRSAIQRFDGNARVGNPYFEIDQDQAKECLQAFKEVEISAELGASLIKDKELLQQQLEDYKAENTFLKSNIKAFAKELSEIRRDRLTTAKQLEDCKKLEDETLLYVGKLINLVLKLDAAAKYQDVLVTDPLLAEIKRKVALKDNQSIEQ